MNLNFVRRRDTIQWQRLWVRIPSKYNMSILIVYTRFAKNTESNFTYNNGVWVKHNILHISPIQHLMKYTHVQTQTNKTYECCLFFLCLSTSDEEQTPLTKKSMKIKQIPPDNHFKTLWKELENEWPRFVIEWVPSLYWTDSL